MNDEQKPFEKVFEKKNPYVGVAGSVGVFACGVAFMFLVFAGGSAAWPAAFAVASLAVMGIFITYFASKKS